MSRLLRHVRANAVGYLALTVALTGTSYAAISPGANTVGAPQLKNHSIDPVKFDSHVIGGFVRHWAKVDAAGRITSSSGGTHILPSVGQDEISWRDNFSLHCTPLVTVENPSAPGGPSAPAFADASTVNLGRRVTGVVVSTYVYGGENQPPSRQPYSVAIVCPTPSR